MRFSVVTVSMLAGAAVAATSTEYVTEEVTITSCAATVTNCPAHSTTVSTTVYPKTTGPAEGNPATTTGAPAPSDNLEACAVGCKSDFDACRIDNSNTKAQCASNYATCLRFNPFDTTGSVVTPTACSPIPSATPIPTAGFCKPSCISDYDACRSDNSNTKATCASTYATCLEFYPFNSNGTLTTCQSTPSATSIPGGCNPAHPGSCPTSTGDNSGVPSTMVPVNPGPPGAPKPSGTGSMPNSGNVTSPAATGTPLSFTGAAANVHIGGAAIAAIFGVVAFLL